jgi:hypothetical protein
MQAGVIENRRYHCEEHSRHTGRWAGHWVAAKLRNPSQQIISLPAHKTPIDW